MKISSVKKSEIDKTDLRVDASYHLSDGRLHHAIVTRNPFKNLPLKEVTERIFSGNIFKRLYVADDQVGYHYLTASDMAKSDIETGKYISKKYTSQYKNLKIEKDWILLSCSGTLGNTAYTSADYEKFVGTHDLIRIIPAKDKIYSGYLYAFLSCKYGYSLLTQFGFGGVVKHIEPHHIENIPIPILPEVIQQRIHNLITEASQLRVEANKLLKEAVEIMDEKLFKFSTASTSSSKTKNYSVTIELLKTHNNRLDATYDASWFDSFYSKLERANIQTRTVSELSQKVFTPSIFKRVRTDNPSLGIPFLSGSELLSAFPKMDSFLSKRMSNINSYILKNGWLAVQDAGTIGYVAYIHKYLDKISATNNLIRIIPKEEKNNNPYIFTFLKSKTGQKILKSFEFGSVQKHIDNHQISGLRIPIFSDIYETVTTKTLASMEFSATACFNEKTAIDLIEKEIDQWQQL